MPPNGTCDLLQTEASTHRPNHAQPFQNLAQGTTGLAQLKQEFYQTGRAARETNHSLSSLISLNTHWTSFHSELWIVYWGSPVHRAANTYWYFPWHNDLAQQSSSAVQDSWGLVRLHCTHTLKLLRSALKVCAHEQEKLKVIRKHPRCVMCLQQ